MNLIVATLAERADLTPLLYEFPQAWPEFMYHDLVSARLYEKAISAHPEYCIVAVDRNNEQQLVAKACSLPFVWPGEPDGDLPPDGYDAVLMGATVAALSGHSVNTVSAVEITIQQAARGSGISALMLDALRRNTARLGYQSLIAPVRPNRKQEYPDMPMRTYIEWKRKDGLPFDPWLRVHVRAGARIVGVAPRSMTVIGSLDEWRGWTGLPFDDTGDVHVPGALMPVRCDIARDLVVYVEPNVWVHHRL